MPVRSSGSIVACTSSTPNARRSCQRTPLRTRTATRIRSSETSQLSASPGGSCRCCIEQRLVDEPVRHLGRGRVAVTEREQVRRLRGQVHAEAAPLTRRHGDRFGQRQRRGRRGRRAGRVQIARGARPLRGGRRLLAFAASRRPRAREPRPTTTVIPKTNARLNAAGRTIARRSACPTKNHRVIQGHPHRAARERPHEATADRIPPHGSFGSGAASARQRRAGLRARNRPPSGQGRPSPPPNFNVQNAPEKYPSGEMSIFGLRKHMSQYLDKDVQVRAYLLQLYECPAEQRKCNDACRISRRRTRRRNPRQ